MFLRSGNPNLNEANIPIPTEAEHNLVLVVYSVCFAGAALNHAHDIWLGGLLPYRHVPQAINIFWTSLTVLDLLAVVLIWRRPRAGLVLALSIMVADVAVNSYVNYRLQQDPWIHWYAGASLQLQSLFLGFVAGTAPFL